MPAQIDETAVIAHYGTGDVERRILEALDTAKANTGSDRLSGPLTIENLALIDELHTGGRLATERLVANMALSGTEQVLDIGCGIGGPARVIATRTGCHVTGIDLTPAFIRIAKKLSALTGLSDKTRFRQASALALPFASQMFDAAITIHAAMNISDRDRLYQEAARVLKPGARFMIYDIMYTPPPRPLTFPLPWSDGPETSFLASPDEMQTFLASAGFELLSTTDHTCFALTFFRGRLAASQTSPEADPGPTIRENFRDKLKNLLDNMENGRLAPVEMLARKR